MNFKSILTLTTLLFLLGCNTNSPSLDNKSFRSSQKTSIKKEALLIGVSNYQGSQDDLGGIERDVSQMKELFEKMGFHTTVLFDRDSLQIDNYLQHYHTLGKGDAFAFYYSGHGSFTKDKNGDEIDGKDETIVLSDGNRNYFYIDDNLNRNFNNIQAKKLIIFDSCHSGTAFKAFGEKPRPKSISANASGTEIQSKGFRNRVSPKLEGGEYVVFSASQDDEESLATPRGSLFTNAFVNAFERGGASQKLMNINQRVSQDIANYCQKNGSKIHHPKLSASTNTLKYSTLNTLFATSTPPQAPKSIAIEGKKSFKEGELLSFRVDTKGNKGYLTIFSMEKGEPFIMTQTRKAVSGTFDFQKDFSVSSPIECYKSCTNCQEETSSVYVILSQKPLTKSTLKTKGLTIGADHHPTSMRAFRERTGESFEPIIAEARFTIK